MSDDKSGFITWFMSMEDQTIDHVEMPLAALWSTYMNNGHEVNETAQEVILIANEILEEGK